MGDFVPNVDNSPFTVVGTREEISDQIAYMRDTADTYMNTVDTALENLEDVVSTFEPGIDEISVDIPDIDSPVFPARPIFGDLILDDSWPDALPQDPTITDYGDLDFSIVAPTPPSEISGNFDYSEDEYTSEMWVALFNKTHYDILNGGTGLTDAVHSSIVEREKESRRVNQDISYRQAIDAVGEMGFNLPSGQIAAIVTATHAENLAKDQDSLNNITIKDFELAQANTHFSVTTGAQLEKLGQDMFTSINNRGLEASKAASEYLLAVYSENIKKYLAEYDGVRIGLEAFKTKIEAISSKNESVVRVFTAQMQGYETEINAINAKNTGLIDARKGEIDIYATEVDAVSKEYSGIIEETKANLDKSRIELDALIKNEEISLQAYISKSELSSSVSKDIALVGAQALASALGGINTQTSNSFQGGLRKSEAFNHGESLQEQHSYTEK